MEDNELFNAVFSFKHKTPSDRQDAAACRALINKFAVFVTSLKATKIPKHKCGTLEPLADDRVVPASAFAVHEVEVLQKASQRLTDTNQKHVRGDVWYNPWLPMYGCVIQRSQKNAKEITLEVVFVDGWERKLHFLPTGECVHSAVPSIRSANAPQFCVDLDAELEAKFSTSFDSELRTAQHSKGAERSAAANTLGHQKTPQFIAAIVKRTVASLIRHSPAIGYVSLFAQGGTTDVGLHTGGRARDTCWALVMQVIARNLCCGQGLFKKTMVAFKLKLLRKAVHKFNSCIDDSMNLGDGCARVDDMFFMLQVIIQETVELLESKYEVSALQEQCAALRSRIDAFADNINHQKAAQYILPNTTMLEQLNMLKCDLEIVSPKQPRNLENRESTKERHKRAWTNLEGCNYINGVSCKLKKLLQWNGSLSCSNAYKSILILRTFEAFMFEKSLRLDGEMEKTINLESMQTLVTQYQITARQWRQLPRKTSVLDVEQRSREMLVMWIAFCLVHQQCVKEEPLCAEYKIALQWRDLKVAVLRDRAAISALQCTAKYVRSWNLKARGAPLFHLSKQESTFKFGATYGLNSPDMISVYDCQVKNWNTYVKQKWNVVQQKKLDAAQLRKDICSQNRNLLTNQRLLAEEEERLRLEYPNVRYCYPYPDGRLKSQLISQIQQITSVISQKESALRQALAVPPYLARPLPPEKGDAMQIIFMLTMPHNIEIMGSLCLTAQRALAPADTTPEMTKLPRLSPTTWQQFYTRNSPSQTVLTTSTVFTANLAPFSYPQSWGPSSVDELSSLHQYSSVCIWDPTLQGTALTWADSIGTKMDPFAATEISVVSSFTENLPAEYRHYQWMNAWPGEGDTRGNMVYSKFHRQLDKFEKSAFIALGSVRAFPNQQYRKLQWALLDDILPWSNSCVEIIIRQSLYQVGTLTDDKSPQLRWKTDMFHDNQGLYTFCSTLESISGKLEQTPRSFENIPLLSELAGFASQYSDSARHYVKLFSAMARRWAENTRVEYKNESCPHRIARIRRKECILYGFAVLAFTLGPWDYEVTQEVCELVVLFRTSFLCASITLSSSDEMLRMEGQIDELMSRGIAELVAYVRNNDMNTVLTGLVRLVSATSPENLKWKQFSDVSADDEQFRSCFEAIDRSMDVHYSINLFTGVVLTDGYAPGGLPVNIRSHERFQALFGPSNFEVFSTNGLLRTERKYCDRLYDFALKDDGELFVQELKLDSTRAITCTLQLCAIKWVKELSNVLPARLQELYSHWYWVEQNCVLFRPKQAKCREVLFIATFDSSGFFHCYQVPFIDTKRPYEELASHCDDYDQFAEKDESLISIFKIISKFEIASFLHPLRSFKDALKIELPRFKLAFNLNKTFQFESVEHKGYVLATAQQLDDFLPKFSRYLLLELQDKSDTARSKLRMLVPVGSIEESCDGTVDILLPTKANSNVEVHCYDIHRRFKTLITETIGARLQLAAICSRAGTSVPSKRLRMTGAEAALQMLRACRSSRPYPAFEKETMLTIYKLSYREPAVKILAVTLLREANRLAFLFGETQELNTAMASIDEKSEYADMCLQHVQRNPLRSQFRRKEETCVVGRVQHSCIPVPEKDIVTCGPFPVAENYVKSIELKLKLFLCSNDSTTKEVPSLPLDTHAKNAMSKGMLDELGVSWKTHHSQIKVKLKAAPDGLLAPFTELLDEISSHRKMMKHYLYDSYSRAISSKRDQLLLLGNFLPQLTVTDLVQCAFDGETLRMLAPKLSEKARNIYRVGILRYMELCVLEDKVKRLIWKAKRRGELSDAQVVDELVNDRQWQSNEFPFWLAFEVEGRLQIRHEQYVIAKHLIDKPGTVCQLNMGCGKTRVILPMLFLYFTHNLCLKIVRAHFLSPLLSEARQFMHRYLSASSFHLSVFSSRSTGKLI